MTFNTQQLNNKTWHIHKVVGNGFTRNTDLVQSKKKKKIRNKRFLTLTQKNTIFQAKNLSNPLERTDLLPKEKISYTCLKKQPIFYNHWKKTIFQRKNFYTCLKG